MECDDILPIVHVQGANTANKHVAVCFLKHVPT